MPNLNDLGVRDLREAGIQEHPGYKGAFTRQTAPGAYPAGTRIEKILASQDNWLSHTPFPLDQGHEIGQKATVLGSVGDRLLGYAYFVEWDADPGFAVMVGDNNIAVVM